MNVQSIIILVFLLFATACSSAPKAAPEMEPTSGMVEAPAPDAAVTGMRDDVVWKARAGTLQRTSPAGVSIELPAGATVSGIEVGYDGTVFASDREADRIYAVRDGVAKVIAEGIPGPGPMVLNGSRLIVGTAEGLFAVSLKTDHVAADEEPDWDVARPFELMVKTAPVVGLATDHVGYFVVRTAQPAELLRVTRTNEVSKLDVTIEGTGPIRFDEKTRRLHIDGTAHDYVTIVGEDPAVWEQRDARTMGPFKANGIFVSGGEYWPNIGDQPTSYPDDVLWGFYPEEGLVFEGRVTKATPTLAATACAEVAFAALKEWVATAPPEFFEAVERGASNRFYLWMNDYSQADDPFPKPLRMNNFWYWERKPAVIGRVPGYWKWESTVTQKGECLTPQSAQIDAYLSKTLADQP